MSGTGRVRVTFEDQLREYERRHLHEERRPLLTSAADVLGPGIAPQAVELADWNDESILFTGFYFSRPGAANSPDPAKAWLGLSMVDPSGTGYMRVTEYDDLAYGANLYPAWPGPAYTRAFNTAGGTTRLFSAWVPDAQTWYKSLTTDETVVDTTIHALGTLTQTIPTYSTAERYEVTASLDVMHTGTLDRSGVFELWVGGVVIGQQLVFASGGIDGLRIPCSKTWMVSPLAAGTTVFMLTGRVVGGPSDTFVVRNTHSTMSIVRVS